MVTDNTDSSPEDALQLQLSAIAVISVMGAIILILLLIVLVQCICLVSRRGRAKNPKAVCECLQNIS